ncbi:PREDICTED: uncharacterized protein LOC106149504, partial [Chinchilla lanigera]|uniref:uncharacterized protein LOC106149504 n=1 Tax=Chinchilla lanigera TaxID=34839 RepID=UPI0006968C7C
VVARGSHSLALPFLPAAYNECVGLRVSRSCFSLTADLWPQPSGSSLCHGNFWKTHPCFGPAAPAARQCAPPRRPRACALGRGSLRAGVLTLTLGSAARRAAGLQRAASRAQRRSPGRTFPSASSNPSRGGSRPLGPGPRLPPQPCSRPGPACPGVGDRGPGQPRPLGPAPSEEPRDPAGCRVPAQPANPIRVAFLILEDGPRSFGDLCLLSDEPLFARQYGCASLPKIKMTPLQWLHSGGEPAAHRLRVFPVGLKNTLTEMEEARLFY